MIQRIVLSKRLDIVENYVSALAKYSEMSEVDFLSSNERVLASERYLHLTIEALCDIGNHIIADQKLGNVDVLRDIPRILAKNSIIPDPLAQKWLDMIGLRNILVHNYLEIDTKYIYNIIKNNLDDITKIVACFVHMI
jgi:uncharacterized protein YutE (UPF0331/DUF86 family)